MNARTLVRTWFEKWDEGDYEHLPVTDDFRHTSPFGTIVGKEAYLDLVRANEDKFLGYVFDVHDSIYEDDKACVRYTARQGEAFALDVSEWYYTDGALIREIVAYYHIGDIREDRKLDDAV